ncbi:MAG: helix-turn-helix domain-containing protein [Lachnospiraceae bacterium]
MNENKNRKVPIWEKLLLTVEEASAYSGIGKNKIYEELKKDKCSFVLRNGRCVLVKRKEFEKFIYSVNEI